MASFCTWVFHQFHQVLRLVDGEFKIYFESEESKQVFMDIEVEHP